MKITKIKIENFKSIGETKNVFYPEKNVSVIIGKNESGKSNLLDCLNSLDFFTISRFGKYKNKLNNKNSQIGLTVVFNEKEIENFDPLISKESYFEFKDNDFPTIQGGLADFISEKIDPIKAFLLEFARTLGGISNDSRKSLTEYFSANFNTDVTKHKQRIQTIKGYLDNKSLTIENRDEVLEKLVTYEKYVEGIQSLLPIFFKFDELELASSYTIDEFKKNISQKNIVNTLFKSAGIELNDVVTAASSTDAGEKQIYQEGISEKIKALSNEFSRFYQREQVSIKINFETNKFHILVDTSRRPMYVSERSNGLRWYLNLFIQLKEQNLLDKNVILLIDEPGVCLHIDAQAKLVELFNDFGSKNQILYTTHSPFMIDSTYLSNIRLVCNVGGYTHIFNSISDLEVPDSSKEEALSPLCKALGFSAKYNIGPSKNKLNIIVEGITDYYYLKGAMALLGVEEDKQPYILPSIGVNNINHIASILLGWGYDFKILVDYDEQAYCEYERLCLLGLENKKEIFTITGEDIDKSAMISSSLTIEDIFEPEDKKLFDCANKTLNAKRFLELSENNGIKLSDKTLDRLKVILKQFEII